jgi:HSP20 family protein
MAPSPFHGIFSAFQTAEQADAERAPATPAKGAPKGVGQIAVDIYEIDDYYIIRAPIAGVRLSDLDIEVDDRTLTIRGMRRQGDELPENRYYLQECFWGEFKRTVTLPTVIDPRKVKATFSKDCILKILIPKEEKVKIVRISEV